ncbi:hypothetical protein FSPOR_564 [Fusarium sporotrichioides]|uniref:Uncharacterized protein n=1 Tax=Fusarium sporotrichioides TaxID=5514 RepID=A0A395SU54_FUSSP|nr:hypothetical protein FSPOR_564 [Fusarium sporotrichioides]
MVRTKTRPRTLEERYPKERYPNGPPKIYLPPKYIVTPNNRVFADHNGKPALMSWEILAGNCPLPPLASWVFYIVHPHAPSDFDGCAFFNKLVGGAYDNRGFFRYKFFFLPGATAEECHAHYVAEIKSRGTIWDQITKVKTAMELKGKESAEMIRRGPSFQYSPSDLDDIGNGQLPGLVVPDIGKNYTRFYGNWFFMFADANLNCSGPEGLKREMYVVEFDPIPVEIDIDSGDTFDPMQHPIYSRRMEPRGDDEQEKGLVAFMNCRAISYWQREAHEATGDVLKLGWKSW